MRSPTARSANNTAANAKKLTTTPAVYAAPCSKACARDCPECFSNEKTFSDSTGNTQGMTFKIRPPRKANNNQPGRPRFNKSPSNPSATGTSLTKSRVGTLGSPPAARSICQLPAADCNTPARSSIVPSFKAGSNTASRRVTPCAGLVTRCAALGSITPVLSA